MTSDPTATTPAATDPAPPPLPPPASAAPPAAAPASAAPLPPIPVGRIMASAGSMLLATGPSLAIAVLLVEAPLLALTLLVGSEGSGQRIAGNLAALAQSAVVTVAVLAALRSERRSVGDLLGASGRRFGPLVMAGMGSGLLIGLGLLLLIVPGLIALTGYFVTTPAVMAEPTAQGGDAMRRSWTLTTGRRWSVFGLALASYAILLGSAAAVVFLLPDDLYALPWHGGEVIAELLTLPSIVYLAAMQAAAYQWLREAHEGQDPARLAGVFS